MLKVFLIAAFSVILIASNVDRVIGTATLRSPHPSEDFSELSYISPTGEPCPVNNMNGSSLVIITDKRSYAPDQVAYVTPEVTDEKGCPANEAIGIQISKDDRILERYSTNSFQTLGLPVDSGTYSVNGSGASTNPASTTFTVVEWYQARYSYFLLVGVLSAIGLMIVISMGIRNYALQEVLRFSLTSGIVFSVILSFVFIVEEIGILAPVGLVKDLVFNASQPTGTSVAGSQQFQWVVNIGGMRNPISDPVITSYEGGIQIPVYVVLFGIAGGYLRYLYEIARLNLKDRQLERSEKKQHDLLSERIQMLRKDKEPDKQKTEAKIRKLETDNEAALRNDMRRLLFYRSIKDLATLFLSPLLALVMYFILVQWAPTQSSVYILAVVSFGTGLVTDEIVRLLIRIVQSIIGSVHAPGEKPEEELEKEEENK